MRGIGTYTTYRRAPERQQDLGLGTSCGLPTEAECDAQLQTALAIRDYNKQQLAYASTLPSGSYKLETTMDGVLKVQEPSFWNKLGTGFTNFVNSDTFKNLTQTATQFYAMKQETAAMKDQADLAERQTALELERLRAGGGMLPGGQQAQPLPNWVLPAAIGGGVLILAMVMMNKKG